MSSTGSGHTAILPTYRTLRSPHRYSDGPRAGRLIARKLGRVTTHWQQYVLDVALERVDGPGSPFAYSDVDVIVGRRCGKTVTTMGVPLFRALSGPVTLDNGRVLPFLGVHTAQNLTKARQRFMKDLVEPYQDSMTPAVWRAGHNLRSAIGDTSLTIDPAIVGKDWRNRRSSQIQIVAPTNSSVRGDGLMHLTFDEYLVFTALRGDELAAAAGPTLGDARGHGQIWRTSNVSQANDSKTALYQARESGRAVVDEGHTAGRAYFEFTIPENADPNDESTWWMYYPALADGIIRIEELRSDLKRLGSIEAFAAEYLGRWPGDVAIALWQGIDRTAWNAAGTLEQQPADQVTAIGVDIDPFGRSTTITAATAHPDLDDVIIEEVLEHGPGSAWAADVIRSLAPSVDAIGIDDYGPGHDLIYALSDDDAVSAKIVTTKSQDFIAACWGFDSRLRERRVRIRTSEHYSAFNDAVAAAQKTTGKGWQWERRVAVSQSPVVAATLAIWALGRAPEPQAFFVY